MDAIADLDLTDSLIIQSDVEGKVVSGRVIYGGCGTGVYCLIWRTVWGACQMYHFPEHVWYATITYDGIVRIARIHPNIPHVRHQPHAEITEFVAVIDSEN